MEPFKHWTGWLLLALGIYQIFAAFIWRYNDHFVMTANAAGVGFFIFAFAFWIVATYQEWANWATFAFGAWLFISGLVFERGLEQAVINEAVVGVLVMIVSFLGARMGRQVREEGQQLPGERLGVETHR